MQEVIGGFRTNALKGFESVKVKQWTASRRGQIHPKWEWSHKKGEIIPKSFEIEFGKQTVLPKTIFHEPAHAWYYRLQPKIRKMFDKWAKENPRLVKDFEDLTQTNMGIRRPEMVGIEGTEVYAEGMARYLLGHMDKFEFLPNHLQGAIRKGARELINGQVKLYAGLPMEQIGQFLKDRRGTWEKLKQALDVEARYGKQHTANRR